MWCLEILILGWNYYVMVMFVIYYLYFVWYKDFISVCMDNINNKVMCLVFFLINLNVVIFFGRNFNYVLLKKYLIFWFKKYYYY